MICVEAFGASAVLGAGEAVTGQIWKPFLGLPAREAEQSSSQ